MPNYKSKAIQKYYDNLVNNLAALDAREIQEGMKFIEECLWRVRELTPRIDELKRQRKDKTVDAALERGIETLQKQLTDEIDAADLKRKQVSEVITKRIEYLQSFPDIDELLKDVQ